ncbi:anoctamin-7-like [Delphinus delphis]|uniref:anoctamin-7-like n=1 Tax=Delphinus delphis TaxID=9728 RepID=UPI0037503FBD
MRKEMQEPDLQRLLGRPPEPWDGDGAEDKDRRTTVSARPAAAFVSQTPEATFSATGKPKSPGVQAVPERLPVPDSHPFNAPQMLAWLQNTQPRLSFMGYLFDHLGTVFFSILMCFWATAFLEHWKHKSTTLAHHWDCSDFQEEEECPHPEFAALAPQMAQNPVTGLKEPYFPPHTRLPRLLTSSAAILIMVSVAMIFLVSVIIYCGIISIAMFHTANSVLMTQAGNVADIGSTVPYLVLILLLGQIYTSLAEQLTRWDE